MPIGLELSLEDRQDDRVLVSLCLAPEDEGPQTVEGAALQIVDSSGDEVCPRMLLPISGQLASPVATTVELRATRALPRGCRVVATAWTGQEVLQTSCPADPYTRLEDFVHGSRLGLPQAHQVELTTPTEQELATIGARMPWVLQPLREPEATSVIEAAEEQHFDDIQDAFHLDDDAAAWLKDLMDEPDP